MIVQPVLLTEIIDVPDVIALFVFTCQSIDVPYLDDPAASREQKMHRLVLQLLMRREQTYLDWLKDAIETLRNQAG